MTMKTLHLRPRVGGTVNREVTASERHWERFHELEARANIIGGIGVISPAAGTVVAVVSGFTFLTGAAVLGVILLLVAVALIVASHPLMGTYEAMKGEATREYGLARRAETREYEARVDRSSTMPGGER